MPTLLNLVGATYPRQRNGQPIPPAEGRSLVPTFSGGKIDRNPLFWEHEGNRAVRLAEWKLVAAHGEPWQLYNLVEDRTELANLAASNPEKEAELSALYEQWAKRCGVEPWPIRR